MGLTCLMCGSILDSPSTPLDAQVRSCNSCGAVWISPEAAFTWTTLLGTAPPKAEPQSHWQAQFEAIFGRLKPWHLVNTL
jgi:hypothetical protein